MIEKQVNQSWEQNAFLKKSDIEMYFQNISNFACFFINLNFRYLKL